MINLYSDTQTLPTPEMYEAMRAAELGDDVQRADPTVNRLETEAAARFGKEAALLTPSGTMANLAALMSHGGPGDEVFLDAGAHVYQYEGGALCSLAGYAPRFYEATRGIPDLDSFRAAIRPENVHFPRPALLWLENTHTVGGGTVLRPERQAAMVELARERGLRVHVDGARIFNASVHLGVSVAELVRDVDSLSMCLSKGLSAPLGSLLLGERDFIDRARRVRKRLGGGMRQAGIIASCGLVALDQLVDRLAEDHRNARALATELKASVPGLGIELEQVETNMIFVDVSAWGTSETAREALRDEGVLVSPIGPTRIRLVTHRHFAAGEVPRVVEAFETADRRLRGGAS